MIFLNNGSNSPLGRGESGSIPPASQFVSEAAGAVVSRPGYWIDTVLDEGVGPLKTHDIKSINALER